MRADAMKFAKRKHEKQKDDDGRSYFWVHCFVVHNILDTLLEAIGQKEDENLCAAALLHDTIEDTDTTYEELVEKFNKDVADLVMEVTHEGQKDNVGYWFPRLHTKRGIMLKFADRLSNLSRLEAWPQQRQDQYLKKSKFWKSDGA